MHLRTTLLLLLVVAALGGVVWWQSEREDSGVFESERPLIDGLQAGRVVEIRVDNLERSVQLTLVRDAESGRWRIVDPIDYPAELSIVDYLLERLENQTAFKVEDADPAGLALDPPRVVVEVVEQIGDERLTRRILLGAVDLDQQHAFASVDGEIVRTLRTLDSSLERDLPDWRSRSIFHDLPPFSVVELRRTGEITFDVEDGSWETTLEAVQDGGWRATVPWSAQLDPEEIGRVLHNLCFLRTQTFEDDAPGDLLFYGLEPPVLRMEVVVASGRREVLRASPWRGDLWVAAIESRPHIFTLALDDVLALTAPVDTLVDRDLMRVVRDHVTAFRLQGAGREVMVERAGQEWLLSSSGAGQTLLREPADTERVADLMTEIERARVLQLLPDVEWPTQGDPAALHVEAGGQVFGGELGPLHTTEDGGVGVLFRRDGDALITLLDERISQIVRGDPGQLRSRQLVKVPELEVARIVLGLGADTREYARDAQGRWARLGTEVEARRFAALVDGLLSVRANRFLPGASSDPEAPDEAPLADGVTVQILRQQGTPVSYTLGLGAEDETQLWLGTRRAVVAPELHRALVELLNP